MPSSVVTPQLNETTAPYQFDGAVTMSGPTTMNGTVSMSGVVAGPATFNGSATIAGVNAAVALSPPAPSDVGLKAWTFPTYLATGTATFSVVGSVYLAMTHLTSGLTYGTIYAAIGTSGGSITTGSSFAGVYNGAGTLVATTADISTVLGTGTYVPGLYYSFPLATAFTVTTAGPYWVGMFFNAGGTASFPVFKTAAGNVTGATGAQIAAGPGTAPFPFAAIATTSATAMPATFALGSAGTTGAIVYWAGLA